MARRASSGINPGILIGIAVFVAAAFFGGKALLGKKSVTLSGAKINVTDMLENANQLRGNEYVVEGKVDEKLRWTPDRGQVVSLEVDVPGGSEFIGIEIPAEFSDLNIERAQAYAIKVKFRQGGIPVATEINRL